MYWRKDWVQETNEKKKKVYLVLLGINFPSNSSIPIPFKATPSILFLNGKNFNFPVITGPENLSCKLLKLSKESLQFAKW